jgi:hypothetical protein
MEVRREVSPARIYSARRDPVIRLAPELGRVGRRR